MVRRYLVSGGVMVAAVAAGLAGWLLMGPESSKASAVEIRENGVVKASSQADDAVAELSRMVGFQVRVPGYVPAGLELKIVESTAIGPSGTPNSLNLAVLSYGPKDNAGPGDAVVRIEQTGFRYSAPEDRARRIDLGKAGADVYFQATERAIGYWVFTEDRGILIVGSGSKLPPESEMRKMVASLVP